VFSEKYPFGKMYYCRSDKHIPNRQYYVFKRFMLVFSKRQPCYCNVVSIKSVHRRHYYIIGYTTFKAGSYCKNEKRQEILFSQKRSLNVKNREKFYIHLTIRPIKTLKFLFAIKNKLAYGYPLMILARKSNTYHNENSFFFHRHDKFHSLCNEIVLYLHHQRVDILNNSSFQMQHRRKNI